MFGYVREYSPELKVKEYTLYKSVYCGLCKSMGKHCGNCSRLTLSYDMTFLAVFRMALLKTSYEVKKERCMMHPFKKRPVMKANEELEYSAKVSALLSYAKLKDDINDSKGIKRVVYKMLVPFFAYAKKRANAPDLYDKINEKLRALSKLENEKCASVDLPANVFGELTGEIFKYGLSENDKKLAQNVGYHTGKWIYACDALDDLKKDLKSGSYNPFLLLFEEKMPENEVELIKSAFVDELAQIEKALDLVDYADDALKAILYNIVYEGMKRKSDSVADSVLNDKGDKN